MTRLLLVPVLSVLLALTAVGTPAGAADGEQVSTRTEGAGPFRPGPTVELATTARGGRDLAVARSGRFGLALAGDHLQRLDLAGARPRATRIQRTLGGDRVVIAPNGTTAYVSAGYERLHVVDLRGGKLRKVRTMRRTAVAPSAFRGLAISRDGKHLYVRYGSTVGQWGRKSGVQSLSLSNPRDPKRLRALNRPDGVGVWELGSSASQRTLVSTDSRGRIVLVRARGARLQLRKVFSVGFEARAVAVAPHGRRAWVASSTTPNRVAEIDLVRARVARVRSYPTEAVQDASVSHDNRFLYLTTQGTTSEPTIVALRTSDGQDVLAGVGGLYPPAVADVPAGPRKGRVLVINGVPLSGGRPALLSLDRS
jgi:DNA-binding beta-propeller fold protein YncE